MSTELDPLLKRLSLANARHKWRDMVARAEKEDWTYEALLQTLFAEEVAHRRGTRLARAVRQAGFPFLRTVEEFDFSYQSTLRLTTIGSLLSPDFVTEGHAVILQGKPGRGKTHLAIALGYRAMQNGFDALFVTAAALIDELSVASREGQLREAVAHYVKPHVLVVDEVGYLTYGNDAANVLFHVVNERHIKRRAMVFTTNKHPKKWGAVLHDDDLADAIVDRILERGRLLRLDGPSVRTRHLAADPSLEDDTEEVGASRRISGNGPAEFPERTRATPRLASPGLRVWHAADERSRRSGRHDDVRALVTERPDHGQEGTFIRPILSSPAPGHSDRHTRGRSAKPARDIHWLQLRIRPKAHARSAAENSAVNKDAVDSGRDRDLSDIPAYRESHFLSVTSPPARFQTGPKVRRAPNPIPDRGTEPVSGADGPRSRPYVGREYCVATLPALRRPEAAEAFAANQVLEHSAN